MADKVLRVSHDLLSLLTSKDRDFLIRSNGDQVKVNNLVGKIVGLYFSASWCGPCRNFIPNLIKVYEQLSSKRDNFQVEIVFISSDKDEETFNSYFSKMPWLAIPFSDGETRKRLKEEVFKVRGIRSLVFLDANGEVCCDQGVKMIRYYGEEGYPFSKEKVECFKKQEEVAKMNQTLSSILVSKSRDYLISKDGNKVQVSDLIGRNILLYFSAKWHPSCRDFLPKLIEIYHKIKAKDNEFEVIFISSDKDQTSFNEFYSEMPWLALPFDDERKSILQRKFKIKGNNNIPAAIVISSNGHVLTKEAMKDLILYGADSYPFTEDHLKKLEEKKMEEEMVKG